MHGNITKQSIANYSANIAKKQKELVKNGKQN